MQTAMRQTQLKGGRRMADHSKIISKAMKLHWHNRRPETWTYEEILMRTELLIRDRKRITKEITELRRLQNHILTRQPEELKNG